jgi:hypothetical protein
MCLAQYQVRRNGRQKTFPRLSENILAHGESMSIERAVENSGKNRDKEILREHMRDVLEAL